MVDYSGGCLFKKMPIPVNVVNGDSFFAESVGYSPLFPYVIGFLIVLVIFLIFYKRKNEGLSGFNSF